MTPSLPASLSAELCAMHKQRLCDDFPYPNRDALDKILEDSMAAIEAGIARQMPAMAAAKARSGFMTLPAELRNSIYELALAPQEGKKRRLWVRSGKFTVESRMPGEIRADWFPPLLKVSRHIREEALSVCWDINEVVLETVVSARVQGTGQPTEVQIKAKEDLALLEHLGQKQCGMMSKVVLKWQREFLHIPQPLTVSDMFNSCHWADLEFANRS